MKRRIPIETHRKLLNMKIAGLRLFGIWSLSPQSSSFWNLLYWLYGKFSFALVLIFVGSLAADLILHYKDILIVTDDGCYLAGISVIVFKLYKFQREHKKIHKLIEDIYKPVDTLRQSSDLGVLTAVKICMFSENLSFKFFTSLGGFLAIALVFFVPKEPGSLPIRAAYPFDTTISPSHEFAFIIQGYSVTYGLFTIVLMDDLVIALIKWINVQLVILESNYKNCRSETITKASFDVSEETLEIIRRFDLMKVTEKQMKIRSFVPFEEEDANVEANDSFIWRFKTCIKHHQNLYNIIDELNEIFSSSMLMQLFASFSMICLTGFQAVLVSGEKTNLFKFVIYLGAALSQLCNWCWFGNELLYQSASLTRGQWLSGWEKENHPNVKSFMIISLIRAKKPLQLKAGKFFNMSMETFTAVLRNSYSFFALLTNVSSNRG